MNCFGGGFVPIIIYSLYIEQGASSFGDLLQEDAFPLFQEDGSAILLED